MASTAAPSIETPPSSKVLTIDSINLRIRNVEYAVRGELAIRAEELKARIEKGDKTVKCKNIVNCNIGNPQQLKQQPITFFRQVAALTEYPELLDPKHADKVTPLFPADAVERAREILNSAGGAIGAYSHSQGIRAIRDHVAQFIEARDGFPADPNLLYLTAGASSGVQQILQLLISHPNVGVMIPIPQYPLYTASLALNNCHAVPYYLDEAREWCMDLKELEQSLTEARDRGVEVRALVIINPGNPTGQSLTWNNMAEVVEFCHRHKLVLLADEVYQTNIYLPETRPFHSFKKVLRSAKDPAIRDGLELVSFHSISKGVVGECGRRGGYFECTNLDPLVLEQIYKMASVNLCPNVQGQILVDLMVKPPQPGSASYPLYQSETQGIYESLKRRSVRLHTAFNSMEGFSCNPAEGAMYLFPSITLSPKAIAAAEAAGKNPDDFYCLAMLDATGVCVIPGSGFGQKPGTIHFRFIADLKKFHCEFMDKYRD
ncbi:pyridoxal phosphate-dependent transferase [Dimargaris cristalligena]|uniref:Glutamate pyruvate transaminase n=1 Tax=Dimargaris cristalligena TaxID=215637 RepID=A0A4P9ZTE7_9FUNG|nr:pyridoxal phosphate-dependent transferase [Dimargaris cristalligena]|eukprot:RKP36488.1 pyridoxal phosphate-dependent transferase [Dimargaris cristalligena]